MKVEKEGQDRTEVFVRLLLIAELYYPSSLEEQHGYFQEMLRKSGIILHHSEFTILDRTWLGNSLVTIAKYALDYERGNDPSQRRVCVEGTVTCQQDEPGNLNIRILTISSPLWKCAKTEEYRPLPVSSKI